MALVLYGKNKGKKVQLHQYANDWAIDVNNNVYKITALLFNDEEIVQIKYSRYVGCMFDEFEIKNNRFYRKK